MTALRVAICGCGQRSRSVWQHHLRELEGFELIGVHDIAQESLQKALDQGTVSPEQCFTDLDALLATTQPDALIVCPPHAAHAVATEKALQGGCHVLVEKPFTTELTDAVRLTELSEERGLKLGVVQNWRTKSVGQALRRAVVEDAIGRVSHIFFRYVRDRELPHLPAYLYDEPDPILYALTVHHIDLFRYALGHEIATVEGHAFRPPWSRYRHPSVIQLWMETDGGVAFSWVGTISSRNGYLEWENFLVEGELGSLYNDSSFSDPPLLLLPRGEREPIDLTAEVEVRDTQGQYDLADRAILLNFREAIVAGEPLISPARENLGTVAAVEAARRALREGGTVRVEAY